MNKQRVKRGSVQHKSHLEGLSVPMFGLGMLCYFDNVPNIATILTQTQQQQRKKNNKPSLRQKVE